MSPAAAVLAKKLRLWFAANEPRTSPVPEIRTDSVLPRVLLDGSEADPAVVRELVRLRAFENPGWEDVCTDLAVILGKLSDASRVRLVESLSLISSSPPVEPDLARRWFSAVNTLMPSSYPTAVMEFFQLSWMWEQLRPVAGTDLDHVLALFHKALRGIGEGPRSAPMIHFMLQLAGRWPERFCYWLDRASVGGPDVVQALKLAESMIPEAPRHAAETLLDFAAEMGWRFLDDDSRPLWRAVGRLGEILFRRLRGIAVSVQNMRLLSGVLGQIERSGSLDSILSDVRVRVASQMFGEKDRAVVEEALESIPEVHGALEAVGEIELIVQATALRGSFTRPVDLGGAIVRLAVLAGGGDLDIDLLLKFLELFEGQIMEEQVLAAVDFLSGLTTVIPRHPVDTWFRMIRLIGLDADEAEVPRNQRNAMVRVMEALAAQTDPDSGLDRLEEALTIPGITQFEVYQASALLLRAAPSAPAGIVLSKVEQCNRLLSLLPPADREWLLANMPPQWLTALASEPAGGMKPVCDALEKLDARDRMLRFLDRIVAPLLEEVRGRDEVFEEYLAAAVVEYNRMPAQGQVRDTEHELLRRMFRTGSQAVAVEGTITDLLRLPGLEGERAEKLVEIVKSLCSVFSRQAVWQEATDNTLGHFLEKGVPRLVTALVDCPQALDSLGPGRMLEMVDQLMPSSPERDSDPQIARWQTRTGVVFFEQVLPLLLEILSDEPAEIEGTAQSIVEQATRALHGLPAGAGYLAEVAERLEQNLIDSYTSRFMAVASGGEAGAAATLPEGWASEMHASWSAGRAAETSLTREATQISRILTSDRRLQRIFVHEARRIWDGLSRAGLLSRPQVLRNPVEGLAALTDLAPGAFLDLVAVLEQGWGEVDPQVRERAERYFGRKGDRPGENACRAWRLETFTPLGACLVDMLLLDGARTSKLDVLMTGFLEVSEFLGTETGGEELLLAFQRCLSPEDRPSGARKTADALRAAEKQLFRPLWRRRAMSRIELLVAGMGNREKLVDAILDRVARESDIVSQVRFLRRFGQLYLSVEEAILGIGDRRSELGVRDSVSDVWLFSGSGREPEDASYAAREAFEAAVEVFRGLRRRMGEVTAEEAEEISAEMRRKYRDNADVVATLLRWTLDPARLPLLEILESNQPLLEAASRDTELIHLMDTLFQDSRFASVVQGAAHDPVLLKEKLLEISGG